MSDEVLGGLLMAGTLILAYVVSIAIAALPFALIIYGAGLLFKRLRNKPAKNADLIHLQDYRERRK